MKRLIQLIPVLVGVSLIAFFMIRLIPGDPAVTLFLAVLVIVVNLMTDLLYAFLDPRVQYE